MPYEAHWRVTVGGRLGAGEPGWEKFNFGFAIAPDGTLTAPQMADVVNDIEAFFNDPDTHIRSYAVMEWVKFASIGIDGLYTGTPEVITSDVAGGQGSGPTHPGQIAMVVSILDTPTVGEPIVPGGRNRGRFYLPAPGHNPDAASGLVSEASAGETATTAAVMISTINTDTGGNVVVASSIDGNHIVDQVRVGRVLDTQRRRRGDLSEGYATAGVA